MSLKRKENDSVEEPKSKVSKEEISQEYEELQKLMKISPEEVGNKDEDFMKYFKNIANLLLNHTSLVVDNKHRFRLAEIEFYYKGGDHQDLFTHCSDDQLTNGEWYFHKQKNTYKDGTYKGLDMTFGEKDKCHGGILIRAIKPAGTGTKVIEGPCNVVDHILKISNSNKIVDLVAKSNFKTSIFDSDSILKIAPETHKTLKVFGSPRYGLTLKQQVKERTGFILRDYRFISMPDLISKAKPWIVLCMYKNKMTIHEICEATKCKEPIVKKYIDTYKASKKGLDSFLGKSLSSVDDMCGIFAVIRGQD